MVTSYILISTRSSFSWLHVTLLRE